MLFILDSYLRIEMDSLCSRVNNKKKQNKIISSVRAIYNHRWRHRGNGHAKFDCWRERPELTKAASRSSCNTATIPRTVPGGGTS